MIVLSGHGMGERSSIHSNWRGNVVYGDGVEALRIRAAGLSTEKMERTTLMEAFTRARAFRNHVVEEVCSQARQHIVEREQRDPMWLVCSFCGNRTSRDTIDTRQEPTKLQGILSVLDRF